MLLRTGFTITNNLQIMQRNDLQSMKDNIQYCSWARATTVATFLYRFNALRNTIVASYITATATVYEDFAETRNRNWRKPSSGARELP